MMTYPVVAAGPDGAEVVGTVRLDEMVEQLRQIRKEFAVIVEDGSQGLDLEQLVLEVGVSAGGIVFLTEVTAYASITLTFKPGNTAD